MAKVKHISYTTEELEQILHRSESIAIEAQPTGVQDAGRNRLANQIKIDGQTYDLHGYYNLPIGCGVYGLVRGVPAPDIHNKPYVAKLPVYVDENGDMSVIITDDTHTITNDSQHIGTLSEIIQFFTKSEIYY